MKLAIGIPLRGEYIHIKFWEGIRSIDWAAKIITKIGYDIDFARNLIVEEALKHNCSHLLFVDDDIIVPKDSLTKLIAHKKDIVMGLYFTKKPPHTPAALMWHKKPVGGYMSSPIKDYNRSLIECDAVGMGCTLINMEVFKKMKRPWFVYLHETRNEETKTITQYAEDNWFCVKAKKLGYKVFVDTNIRCGHLSTKIITEEGV